MQENEKEILAWCRKTVYELADGGVWGIPRSMMIFRIDKTRKKFILVEGNSQEEINAINYWFGKIGYSVEKPYDPNQN
jgi:hypothetical protein